MGLQKPFYPACVIAILIVLLFGAFTICQVYLLKDNYPVSRLWVGSDYVCLYNATENLVRGVSLYDNTWLSVPDYLKQWKGKKARKPLVIRGARQVGKSYLVRLFASECFENIVEVNCERDSDAASLLPTGDPVQACRLLEARFNMTIKPGKTLLFLDEIQASPSLFAGLRYFYETMPELHVIAAGSLLDFVL